MKYRNTKNGVVIDVESVIHGDNWEAVKTVSQAPTKKASSDKPKEGTKKK